MPEHSTMSRATPWKLETWESLPPHQTLLGNGSCGTFLQGPGEAQTEDVFLACCGMNPITSIGLPRPLTFTIEWRSITSEPLRRTGSYPPLAKNMVDSTFSLPRWKPICTFSMRYGNRYSGNSRVRR